MKLKFYFFIPLVLFSIFAGRSSEIQKIDAEIAQLEEMKRGYEAKALKSEDMATYLQFDSRTVLETRRLLEIAEENRNKAALVQERIDKLKGKRQQLEG